VSQGTFGFPRGKLDLLPGCQGAVGNPGADGPMGAQGAAYPSGMLAGGVDKFRNANYDQYSNVDSYTYGITMLGQTFSLYRIDAFGDAGHIS